MTGVTGVTERHAGKQSRVFAAEVGGVAVAIKLTDAQLVDPGLLERRLAAVESLALQAPDVVGPQRLDGRLVRTTGGWLATATPLVNGHPLDVTQPSAVRGMGAALARLHAATSRLPPQDLPPVAALGTMAAGTDRNGWQLLHGDFNEHNVISTPGGLRIIDFDDCGYGTAVFDVANALYMVLFDAEVGGRPERAAAFRPAFLAGYAETAGVAVDSLDVDDLIALRIGALAAWLDDESTAPIGIRTSSPEWKATLRSFVRAHAT